MKNLFTLKPSLSNPSYLGADRVWSNVNDFDKNCREDVVVVKDYDDV